MNIRIREVDDADMPEGHDWATVVLDDCTWLLVRRVEARVINEALRELDCA